MVKKEISKKKLKRSFLRNCFLFCYFFSQGYSFHLKKPFANTVLLEFAKWYLDALRGLWWKRNILRKNWKESFWETVLCSVNTSHRVTAFLSISILLRLFKWNFQSDISKPIEGYGDNEISSVKNLKAAFWETALCSVNSSHRVQLMPQDAFR